MKISSIYCKNINSLEGENRIYFDRAPLKDCGVFAITGDNGSGKSSILDVLTLALYGETFRFGHLQGEVITNGKNTAVAEVDFSVAGSNYRASLLMQKTAGTVQTPTMRLLQIDGNEQVLASNRQQVHSKIAELIGMDFASFGKSVVLAQGKFAAFLHALDSERLTVLEKISGGDIYSQQVAIIRQNHSDELAKLQKLQQDMEATRPDVESQQQDLLLDLADFTQQAADFGEQLQSIERQLANQQNYHHCRELRDKHRAQLQELTSLAGDNSKQLATIAAIQTLPNLTQDLAQLHQHEAQHRDITHEITDCQHKITHLQEQIDNIDVASDIAVDSKKFADSKIASQQQQLQQMQTSAQDIDRQLLAKKATIAEYEPWLVSQQSRYALLQNMPPFANLFELQQALSNATSQQQAIQKSSHTAQQLQQKNKQLQQSITAAQQTLAALGDAPRLAAINDLLQEQTSRCEKFKQLHKLALAGSKRDWFLSRLFKPKKSLQDVERLNREYQQLQLAVAASRQLVDTLQNAVHSEYLLQKMSAERVHLQNETACPLCGALNHPYQKYPPAVGNYKNELAIQQMELGKLQSQQSELAKQITHHDSHAAKKKISSDKTSAVHRQWSALANQLNVASQNLTIDQTEAVAHLWKLERQKLQKIAKYRDECNQQQTIIAQSTAAIADVQAEIAQLAHNAGKPADAKAKLSEATQTIAAISVQIDTLQQTIAAQLHDLGEQMPATQSEQAALTQRLEREKQDWQDKNKQLQLLSESVATLHDQQSEIQNKISQSEQSIADNLRLIVVQEQQNLQTELDKERQLHSTRLAAQTANQAAIDAVWQRLLTNSHSITAGDSDTLAEHLRLLQNKDAIGEYRLQLQQDTSISREELTKAENKLDTLPPHELSPQQLQDNAAPVEEKLAIAQEEMASCQRKIDQQAQVAQLSETLTAKIDSQKKIVQDCTQEVAFISEDNGSKFAHRCRYNMAQQLLGVANKILGKISGRYHLRQMRCDYGFGIQIQDHKQQNLRLPKTLSGGESFVISLSLALALAEMSATDQSAHLFIDEGFGSLDADSLYLVMSTLENLKTQGKTIGVISHVEAVQKRIKTQIKMIKKPNGMSLLKIVS